MSDCCRLRCPTSSAGLDRDILLPCCRIFPLLRYVPRGDFVRMLRAVRSAVGAIALRELKRCA